MVSFKLEARQYPERVLTGSFWDKSGAQYRDRTCDLSHVKGTRYRCANWAYYQNYYTKLKKVAATFWLYRWPL